MPKMTYRPSLERHNAPYRGVTSREDMVNFDLATIHDLAYIQKIASENPDTRGHLKQIEDNFAALYHNEGIVTASVPSAGALVKRMETLSETTPIDWQLAQDGKVKPSTDWQTYELTGSLHQSGIRKIIEANPGDTLVIRTQIKAVETANTTIALGAINLDNNLTNLTTYPSSQFKTKEIQYIEKRIEVTSKQPVELVIFAVYGNEGTGHLLLTDCHIHRYSTKPMSVTGMDAVVKQELHAIQQQLGYLEERRERLWY